MDTHFPMMMRCPPEPTRCPDWKHKQMEEGPPRPELCRLHPFPQDPGREGLCVSSAPRERGSGAPGVCPP